MRRIVLSCLLLLGVVPLHSQTSGDAVDFNQARQLFERRQRGETLTPEEDLYLKRAVAARNHGGARPANQRQAPERLPPLADMRADERYEAEDGGLYGGGRNTPPPEHRRVAETELAGIRPLNAEGESDENGVIGFVSLSMSNATQEFSRFKQVADRSSLKSAKVVIVDCAQGGQAMAEWAPADARPWEEARRRLAAAMVSPRQVQAAWIKLANKGPTGSFQDHGRKLERDTLAVLHHAKAQFPNLRIAYLGSRIYGGNATGGLNPEPYAYESAFATRWLIQRQMRGDPELALTRSPLLLWGPYLWAGGTKGRKLDALVWERADFGADGVHPSDSGRQKVAELLLNFLTTDPLAKPWFTRGVREGLANPGSSNPDTRIGQNATVSQPPPLQVEGNRLKNPRGAVVRLEGVNIASLEWSSRGENILKSVAVAIDDWGCNLIRLPLSQDRWFGRAKDQNDGGLAYRQLVEEAVRSAAGRRCYVLLDLHWSNAGVWGANIAQHWMPDDNSGTFWESVAAAYANHPAVLFDLYNEPHDVSWELWRNGGMVGERNSKAAGGKLEYHSPGLQKLLDVCRAQGALNVVVAGGLDWAYDLSGLTNGFALADPKGRGVVYATHIYPWKKNWDRHVTVALDQYTVLVGEVGCQARGRDEPAETWAPKVLAYIQRHQLNWTAWDFHPSASPCLIRDWNYAPTPHWGTLVQAALREAAAKRDKSRLGE